MKAKDKAKELVHGFWMTNPMHNTDIGERNYVNAIKCALIACEELWEECADYRDKYWEEVQKELIIITNKDDE